jgi:hypothetical protein
MQRTRRTEGALTICSILLVRGYHNRRWSKRSYDDESIVFVMAIQAMPIG